MTNPVLWERQDHTAAKHRVLRSYLDAWIPVMGQQAQRTRAPGAPAPRLLLLDGFAGPGRYAGGEVGSPLIMLDAVRNHSAIPRMGDVEFLFLFIEQDARRLARLQEEVTALGVLPPNISINIEHGAFEATFGSLIDDLTERGKVLIPTFAFIDPFGYSSASMSLAGRFLDFPRCEALTFLPLSAIHRFVGRDGQERALTSFYGCEDWRGAIPLEGAARSEFLLELFEHKIGESENVKHVRSFQLRTKDGNDYRLVFSVAHDRGLEIAKDAMWAVDPLYGTSYSATTVSGQEVLFSPEVDTKPLLAELRAKFGTSWFSIEDADQCTLLDTPFRKGHLRQKTLQPAERAGALEVERPGRTGFVNARMRFLG